MRHTKEVLEEAVSKSSNVMGVLRHLGLKMAGGTHSYISRRIHFFGLDTSHFTGKASNQGKNHRGGAEKIPWQRLLVLRSSGQRQKAFLLRRALIDAGVPYVCMDCGNIGVWRNRPLILQVNHKNGCFLDDRKENLEFSCPNCHSQTEGWSGNKGGTSLTSIAGQGRRSRARRRRGSVVEQVDTPA